MHLTFKLQREILQHTVFNNSSGKRPEIVSILNVPVCGQAASGDICLKTQTDDSKNEGHLYLLSLHSCDHWEQYTSCTHTFSAPPHLGHSFLHCSHPASLFADSIGPFLIVPQGLLVTHRLDELEAFSSYTCGSLCQQWTNVPATQVHAPSQAKAVSMAISLAHWTSPETQKRS